MGNLSYQKKCTFIHYFSKLLSDNLFALHVDPNGLIKLEEFLTVGFHPLLSRAFSWMDNNLTEKSECRLNKPSRHNNDDNRLHYDLFSLSERFAAEELHMPGTVSKVAVRDNLMSLALASVTSTQLRVTYQSGPLAS